MIIPVLVILVVIIDVAIFWKLTYAFRLLRMRQHVLPNEDELPSVTVCIPARNEIHAMTSCLDRVVASDYPKLEIIVLDDESRDETSILIKSYASSGVRFVEGKPLPEGWLGRNYAQNILAHEASGSVVFFMDVDTQIRVQTISRVMAYMLGERSDMVSIIPRREDAWRATVVFSTLRHFWTVVRFRGRRPRAASNAWFIKRDVLLERLEKDETLPISVQLETTIARALVSQDKYRLVLSDTQLGLSYEKKWRSQLETSIRLLYPQCNKHWYAALGLAGILGLTLLPYVLLPAMPLMALPTIVLQYVVAWYYLAHVWSRYSWIGALFYPLIVLQELVLVLVSMWRYNFGVITWKGRPITTSKTPH